MAALRFNILSNYAGQLWMAAIGIAFLPMYIRILGMEAFGFVGLMLSFQSILQLFDFGIGGATNRELSRRAHDRGLAAAARDLVRTSEVVIWALPLAAALLVWACSGPMADHWLHLREMGREEGRRSIAIMGVAVALLWPGTFYANCLSGLERQPALNALNAAFATLRYAGVLPLLLWVSPTIEAFLWWHAVVGLAQSLAMAAALWKAMPAADLPARVRLAELHGHRAFAGGLFGIGLLALAVTQLDRLVLASLRPLEEMGRYTLALSIASGLARLVQPMFNAIYPRFSRLLAQHEDATLGELYHLASQHLAVVVAPVAAVLIVFARDVLFLWTGDPRLAAQVAPAMALLVAGTAFNGMLSIPGALQLASGWTRLALGLNAVSLAVCVPYCLWAVPRFGTTGAAGTYLLANLVPLLAGIPLMHRRLLRGEMRPWWSRDILPPLLASVATALLANALLPPLQRNAAGVAMLAIASGCTLLVAAASTPATRRLLRRWPAGLFAGRAP